MLKNIIKIIEFLFKHPKSFYNINLWARDELILRPLTSLADARFSDKGFRKHFYTRIYNDLFLNKQNKIKNILEIGLLNHRDQKIIGGDYFTIVPSLDMWAKLFPNANVYGFDIKDFSSASGNWKKIYKGDQSNRKDLEKMVSEVDTFDLIIDDALHSSFHQQVSFSFLFPYLSKKGIYIIEDLHYQPFNENENHILKTSTCLQKLKIENVWPSLYATQKEKYIIEKEVDSIQLYDSMSHGIAGQNALAIIRKC
jgi:hypothetical protein